MFDHCIVYSLRNLITGKVLPHVCYAGFCISRSNSIAMAGSESTLTQCMKVHWRSGNSILLTLKGICTLPVVWRCTLRSPSQIMCTFLYKSSALHLPTWSLLCLKYTLRNYSYIDMDPLHPMSFWRLLARLDMDLYPQNRCDGFPVWFKLPSPVWTNNI